ncbi:helix-hairpin-helix domain-containing protein [Dyadobacter flavalbus]|uniref:Helix-hairpin-helix domain-containing protein n=1 Tax=Dyadobacter flavalbus TaxID=2579942 RepID=A0A5M8QXI5_9BACT|nr:helix-hairpin-helix domain-containing protein [Dyadobacter flavalbus]KAA6440068.1 helix-hairpin-helix domain-containing protein [Dyadobacter flavalbus]
MLIFYKNAYALKIFCCNPVYAGFYGLITFLLFVPAHVFGQEPPRREIDINQFIQNLFPDPSEDTDYSDLYESLFQLYANPLDLNTVTHDELASLFILSDIQLKSFFLYREKLGPLLSLYELQAVPEFDLATIYRLLPFVTVQPRVLSLRESLKNPTQHFLMLRSGKLLEKQKGYLPASSASASRYQGKSFNGYLKYRNSRAGSYSFGLTMEKDAGEKLWLWNGKRQIFGSDFTSFHAQIMNRRKLKNFIAGDFQMQAGQGLVMAAGFSLGKGSEVIKTGYRSTLGLKPYTSVLEANFFRGIAATIAPEKNTELSVFYSFVNRDATEDNIPDEPDKIVASSLPVTGYHRTPAEQKKHNNLSEQNAGMHLLYKMPSQNGQVGVTMLYTFYSLTIRKRDAAYNRYEFTGNRNLIIGMHGDYRWQNFHFFGEGARSQSGGLGAVGGMIAGLGKKLDLTLLARHYDKHFHTFYGNPFGEGSRPINETGLYAGLKYAPNRRWQFSTFYDLFWFPWLKYQVDSPSRGHDYYLHALWKPNRKFNAYALFHEKRKQKNQPGNHAAKLPLGTTVHHTAMINIEYDFPLLFSLRTRLQSGSLNYLKISKSKGFTVLQDISWHFRKMELSARIAYFNTDDYDSRQYIYEKDMLYAFSIPACYDTGTRHYMMVRYNLDKHLKLWVRWSQTRYSHLDKISSGLNEIEGNKRSEIKMQMMYQF